MLWCLKDLESSVRIVSIPIQCFGEPLVSPFQAFPVSLILHNWTRHFWCGLTGSEHHDAVTMFWNPFSLCNWSWVELQQSFHDLFCSLNRLYMFVTSNVLKYIFFSHEALCPNPRQAMMNLLYVTIDQLSFYSFISMELWMFIIYHSRCLFLKGSQVTPRLCSYNWLLKPKFKRFVLFNSPCVQSSVPECQNGLQSRIWHPQNEFAALRSWELSKCLINTSQCIISEHRIIKH